MQLHFITKIQMLVLIQSIEKGFFSCLDLYRIHGIGGTPTCLKGTHSSKVLVALFSSSDSHFSSYNRLKSIFDLAWDEGENKTYFPYRTRFR